MRTLLSLMIFSLLLLSACSAAPTAATATPADASSTAVAATLSTMVSATLSAAQVEAPAVANAPEPTLPPATPTAVPASNQPAGQDLTRSDAQGAVEVDVTPNNLTNPGETIEFEVGLNTHSVNLTMDLAKLATLETDTGLSASAVAWDGGSGGHHVSGNLSFPTQVNGKSLLTGAKVLTLVIKNVAAPERIFSWNLQP